MNLERVREFIVDVHMDDDDNSKFHVTIKLFSEKDDKLDEKSNQLKETMT